MSYTPNPPLLKIGDSNNLLSNGAGYSTLNSGQVAFIQGTVQLVNQSADVGTTNFNLGGGRLFRVNYVLEDTTSAIGAGAVTLTISWTDVAGATNVTATQVLTGVGRTQGSIYINSDSGNVSYAVSHTGIFSTAKYALYMTLEKLL